MEKAGGGVSTLDYSQYSQLNQADDSIDTDRFSWSNLPKGAEAAYKKANNPGAFTKLQTSFNAAFNSARTAIREACSSAKESIKSSMLGAYNSIPSFSDATTSASSSLKSLAKRFSFGYTRVPTKEPEDTGLSAENLAKLPTEKGIEGDDRMSTTTEDRASITSRDSMTGRPSEDGDVVEMTEKGLEGDDRMSTTTEDRASITSRNSMTGRPSEDGDVVEISKDSPSVL